MPTTPYATSFEGATENAQSCIVEALARRSRSIHSEGLTDINTMHVKYCELISVEIQSRKGILAGWIMQQ
jgi:hypothetical protein